MSDVIEDYKSLLSYETPRFFKSFMAREKDNPDAAKFEAASFSIMRSRDLEIEFGEKNKGGGADFICTGTTGKFALEVTTINTSAMEENTEMKNDQRGIDGGFYLIYPTLYQKMVEKVKQLSQYPFPGIVAIGSFHGESLTLFRDVLADEYLKVFFSDALHGSLAPDGNLKNISAFLLIGFGCNDYSIMGFLNPAPAHLFDIRLLPDIAFRQMTRKGLKEKTGEGKWVRYKRSHIDPSFRYDLDRISRI